MSRVKIGAILAVWSGRAYSMIVFSDHAIDQNKKRKIPESRILQTVTDPDDVEPSSRGRVMRKKQFGKKILEVITVTEGSRVTVITQYYIGELP